MIQQRTRLALLVLLNIALAFYLLGQLWYRQQLPQFIDAPVSALAQPAGNLLNRLNVQLPARRNLSQLTISGVRQTPHPLRTSIMSMQARIVNRAAIKQDMPGLQLSLNDRSGKLIARRDLWPNDYLPNPQASRQIDAKQIRPISLEMQAFPKQTYGYELKVLAK